MSICWFMSRSWAWVERIDWKGRKKKNTNNTVGAKKFLAAFLKCLPFDSVSPLCFGSDSNTVSVDVWRVIVLWCWSCIWIPSETQYTHALWNSVMALLWANSLTVNSKHWFSKHWNSVNSRTSQLIMNTTSNTYKAKWDSHTRKKIKFLNVFFFFLSTKSVIQHWLSVRSEFCWHVINFTLPQTTGSDGKLSVMYDKWWMIFYRYSEICGHLWSTMLIKRKIVIKQTTKSQSQNDSCK